MNQKNLSSWPSLAITDGDILAVIQRNGCCAGLAGGLFPFEAVDHQVFKILHFNSVSQVIGRWSAPFQIKTLNGETVHITAEQTGNVVFEDGPRFVQSRS